jgi:hypothetical protein
MNVVFPPLLFYALGAFLMIAGALRAVTLGRRHGEVTDDTEALAKGRKRHVRYGVIWILLGVFLIYSTANTLRKRAGLATPEIIPLPRTPPTVHFDPAGVPPTVGPPAEPKAPH